MSELFGYVRVFTGAKKGKIGLFEKPLEPFLDEIGRYPLTTGKILRVLKKGDYPWR